MSSGYVCDELIDNILKRLPPRSLLRFRCLSKSWCSRITSSDFIRTHLHQSPQKVLIFHSTESKKLGMECFYTIHSEDQLPLTPKHRYTGIGKLPSNYCIIAGSCNGVLCLYSLISGTITLWNPSIRRKQTLPHPPIKNFSQQEKLYAPVGFGFNTVTDDYTVVKIFYSSLKRSPSRSMVYTTNTNTWRTIGSPVTRISGVKGCGCFFNGALYWIVLEHGMRQWYIMSFDLSTEVVGRVVLPKPCLTAHELIVVNGSLAVITSDQYNHNFTIWVMREDDNVASWSVFIKLECLPSEEELYMILPLTTNGDLVFKTNNKGFKVYNPATGIRSTLVNFNARSEQYQIERYVECLVLLNKGTDCNGSQQSWLQPKKGKQKKKIIYI